jgi:hypothetical protein
VGAEGASDIFERVERVEAASDIFEREVVVAAAVVVAVETSSTLYTLDYWKGLDTHRVVEAVVDFGNMGTVVGWIGRRA